MLQSLLTCQSFLLVYYKKFANKIFAFFRDLVELLMIEMEISFLDLTEDLGCVRTLERQVTANQSVE